MLVYNHSQIGSPFLQLYRTHQHALRLQSAKVTKCLTQQLEANIISTIFQSSLHSLLSLRAYCQKLPCLSVHLLQGLVPRSSCNSMPYLTLPNCLDDHQVSTIPQLSQHHLHCLAILNQCQVQENSGSEL